MMNSFNIVFDGYEGKHIIDIPSGQCVELFCQCIRRKFGVSTEICASFSGNVLPATSILTDFNIESNPILISAVDGTKLNLSNMATSSEHFQDLRVKESDNNMTFGKIIKNSGNVNSSNNEQLSSELIQQLIFVLCDMSGSMGSRTAIKGFNRLDFTSACFHIFLDRLQAIAQSIKIGLITFDHEIIVQKDLDDYSSSFHKLLDNVKPRGGSAIYKAIFKAISLLSTAKKDFSNAQLRIILLTDGGDNNGGVTPYNLLKLCCQHEILLDSFFIAKEFDAQLIGLTRLSGGCAFYDEDLNNIIKTIQRDEFIDISKRKISIPNIAPSESALKQTSADHVNFLNAGLEMKSAITESISGNFVTSKKMLVSVENYSSRILKELHLIYSLNLEYIKIFPNQQDIKVWKILLMGPENSPYANRWFYLSISFSNFYPKKCPIISFVSPPYHLNISNQGAICLDILGEGYDSRYHIIDLLMKIRSLLANPRIDSPVDFERLTLSPQEFQTNVQQFNNKNSRENYQEWLTKEELECSVDDSDEHILLNDPKFIPFELRCPISKNKIRVPVRASTGVVYDRAFLEQLLHENGNAICVITKKKFTDQDRHLETDIEVQKELQKYAGVDESDYGE